MAKNVYVGVSNVAHKVKKVYVGVSNVARKVKKIYVGVSNVARLVFTSELKVEKVSSINPLGHARSLLAAASVGNRVIFAGGYSTTSDTVVYHNNTRSYNRYLTRNQPTVLSVARSYLSGASVGNYALFACGTAVTSYSIGDTVDTVDAYNTSLTRSIPAALSLARAWCTGSSRGGASVGDYAIFAGGWLRGSGSTIRVDAYDKSLTRTAAANMSIHNISTGPSGTSVGNYALFVVQSVTDAYNTSLIKSTPTALSVSRYATASASVGDYALFAGGTTGYVNNANYYGVSDVVDAYNKSLIRSTPTVLSVARDCLAGASIGTDYALFGGGVSYTYSGEMPYDVVDAYDKSLTRSTPTVLDVARYSLAGGSVGNYALFGGGKLYNSNSSTYYDTVDAYTA